MPSASLPEAFRALDADRPPHEAVSAPISEAYQPTATGGPDIFGYTWDDSVNFAFIPIDGVGTQIFPDPDNPGSGADDESAGPFAIGFSFPFYENAYSEVYVSDNGIITFGEGSINNNNRSMPNDAPPDDVIAPFWDDLAVGGEFNNGAVYAYQGSDAGGAFFVVEWHNISRSGDTEHFFIFEAVLRTDGDIFFYYQNMDGDVESATVGIEDGDGVDGLTYLHNAAGISELLAIKFTRPPASPRAKALPLYQSSFTENGNYTFPVTVINTGDSGPDTYDLTPAFTGGNPAWTVTLLDSDGITPLTDTNSNGTPDTGSIPVGNAKTIYLRLAAPNGQAVGDYTRRSLTATSNLAPEKWQPCSASCQLATAAQVSVEVQAAVPGEYTHAYMDNASGMNLERVLPARQEPFNVVGFLPGSTFALEATSRGHYFYAWEVTAFNPLIYTDLEYTLLNPFGSMLWPRTRLTENSAAAFPTRDVNPQITSAPDGRLGIVWARIELDFIQAKVRYNIFFAILTGSGQVLVPPTNLTNNTQWGGGSDVGVPKYSKPTIGATADNHFVLVWADDRLGASGTTGALDFSAYTTTGLPISQNQVLLQGVEGGNLYSFPNLTGLTNNRLLLAHSVSDQDGTTYSIGYMVLDSSGAVTQAEGVIPSSSGWAPDATSLSTSSILLGWADPSVFEINFTLLSDNGTTVSLVPGSLQALPNPDGREADFLSVTRDSNGFGVFSWLDAELSQRMYYALVSPSGGVVTPAMISRVGAAAEPLLSASTVGQGLAPIYDGELFLPVVASGSRSGDDEAVPFDPAQGRSDVSE